MTNRAEFERLLDVYGFRCERFGQDLSTHARAQVVSAFAALASAPVAGEAQNSDSRYAVKSSTCGDCAKGAGDTYRDSEHFHKTASIAELGAWQRGWDDCRDFDDKQRAALSAQPGAQKEQSDV